MSDDFSKLTAEELLCKMRTTIADLNRHNATMRDILNRIRAYHLGPNDFVIKQQIEDVLQTSDEVIEKP